MEVPLPASPTFSMKGWTLKTLFGQGLYGLFFLEEWVMSLAAF
jgi:hypothetical protein